MNLEQLHQKIYMNVFKQGINFSKPTHIGFKKTILVVKLFFCLFSLNAQDAGNVQLNVEVGMLWDWLDEQIYMSGPFIAVEPKLKTSKNTTLGLRVGASYNTQIILISNPNQFNIDGNRGYGNGIFSFVPTVDYYFGKKDYRPYIGMGLGYYFLTTTAYVFNNDNPVNEAVKATIDNQVGFLLRGGFHLNKLKINENDLSKFIIGVEFNYIPKADVEIFDTTDQKVGTINNTNLALSIGCFLGRKK